MIEQSKDSVDPVAQLDSIFKKYYPKILKKVMYTCALQEAHHECNKEDEKAGSEMLSDSKSSNPYFIGNVFDSLIEKCIEKTIMSYIKTLSESNYYSDSFKSNKGSIL